MRLTSDDEILEFLKKLNEKLKRPLNSKDLKNIPDAPSLSTFYNRFGGWEKALKLAGIPVRKKYITPNGIKCKSWYEYRFALMCEEHDIIFDQEYRYDFLSNNVKRKFRFDFILVTDLENGNYCLVELFFIKNNEAYSNRKSEKIKICYDNNIPFMYLDERDIESFYE